jgi:hypothetical protein
MTAARSARRNECFGRAALGWWTGSRPLSGVLGVCRLSGVYVEWILASNPVRELERVVRLDR